MQITLFVKPESLLTFVSTMKILSKLNIDNDFKFDPESIVYSEKMISDFMWVTVDIDDYLKLKYCIGKLKIEISKK